MVRENDLVAIFHSIHRVMQAEKILKQQAVEVLLIPVPRQLSSDCGLALRYSPDSRERFDQVLAGASLQPAEVFRRLGKDYERVA